MFKSLSAIVIGSLLAMSAESLHLETPKHDLTMPVQHDQDQELQEDYLPDPTAPEAELRLWWEQQVANDWKSSSWLETKLPADRVAKIKASDRKDLAVELCKSRSFSDFAYHDQSSYKESPQCFRAVNDFADQKCAFCKAICCIEAMCPKKFWCDWQPGQPTPQIPCLDDDTITSGKFRDIFDGLLIEDYPSAC